MGFAAREHRGSVSLAGSVAWADRTSPALNTLLTLLLAFDFQAAAIGHQILASWCRMAFQHGARRYRAKDRHRRRSANPSSEFSGRRKFEFDFFKVGVFDRFRYKDE